MIEIVVVTIIVFSVVIIIFFLIWCIEINYVRNQKQLYKFSQRYRWFMDIGLKESASIIRVKIIQEFGHTWI